MQRPFSTKLVLKPLLQKPSAIISIHNASNFQPCFSVDDQAPSTALRTALAGGGHTAELALAEAFRALKCNPNGYALVQLVRACTSHAWDSCGHQLHSYILRSGFASNVFVGTAMVNFYIKTESFDSAHKLFDEMPQPSLVTWNSLISGYVRCGQFRKALCLFIQLDGSENLVDSYSLSIALSASGHLGWLILGQSIHSKVVKLGLEDNTVVANCLIDMYGKCESFEGAVEVFNDMIGKDTISWNSVIAASARNRRLEQASRYLQRMPRPDTISFNELINGYAQFGDIEYAVEILSKMDSPNSSSWNAVLTGYVDRDETWKALSFFTKMHSCDVGMDQFTFSSILSGVAGLSALEWGLAIHCCITKCGLDTSTVVGSALINMYSKCGHVNSAEIIFQSLPKKNLVSWNAMISGLAHNGKTMEVIRLFEKLKKTKDVKPDNITFLYILPSCSDNQVPLEATMQCFKSMVEDYGIKPTIEHCCTMVRLMGQRGDVHGSKRLIHELGFDSSGSVWRALLGACGVLRDLKLAKVAAAKVIVLGAADDYVYVMMSNIFASHGKWRDVKLVRELMSKKGFRKETGYSWLIEMENEIFLSN
ncbi:putative pentatricopeptide repeat-containing protein [Cucumis melo var. makuwa]|uniref:Pentatricopeptide repeat-containing protein n=1 Tax=Cucumis melo var. makuwa TaxID=1194695 RepID=A0A5D3CKT8_CUCMM|nr:putative pentatricopeptide repeat-containing protein [Cucumis melo var. makuwa]TYK12030.1 putative pentatricopeptide repeat-containing protein [Cucumis melo var. makuwa]